ncbi:MAG: cytochrome c [Burkholderiales bacterium]|nr:cytochrome c [Burkholderiales bacterium]
MKTVMLAALLCIASPFAYAGGDAGAGAQKSKACAACHGADFDTPVSADIPVLAGQHEDYLARALADYKSGSRKNPVMSGQAAALSAQDIADIAAYFSGLPGKLKVIRLHRLVQ